MQIVTIASKAVAMAPTVVANDSISPKNGEKPNLIKDAQQTQLVMLSVELSGLIDIILRARMQSQEARNDQIAKYNELLNALRKLQKSPDAFSVDSLDKTYMDVPPDSELARRSAAKIRDRRDRGIAAAKEADERGCLYIEDWERNGAAHSSYFRHDYDDMAKNYIIGHVSSGIHGGTLVYDCIRRDNGQAEKVRIRTYDYFTIHNPKWPSEEAARLYNKYQDTLARLNKEYEVASGKVSLADMFHEYGIYKENEKLPATKEELEAATEKISAIVSAITSTQDLAMTAIQRLTNGGHEAIGLGVSVSDAQIETLKALIANMSPI